MSRIQELIRIFSDTDYRACYARAKATRTCIRCGRSVTFFHSASCRLEYDISALCQYCQDECFNNQRHVNQKALSG
ncbi:MAG: hypothetical protein JRJ85_09150 [Deltaproteobacteria bacterium]|nr:hypothetical protein [Deltaproteobacteria bacterium]